MALRRKLLSAKFEERDDLAGENLSVDESLREEHDLSDELAVWGEHGDAAEELLQVVGEVGAASIGRVQSDKDTYLFH